MPHAEWMSPLSIETVFTFRDKLQCRKVSALTFRHNSPEGSRLPRPHTAPAAPHRLRGACTARRADSVAPVPRRTAIDAAGLTRTSAGCPKHCPQASAARCARSPRGPSAARGTRRCRQGGGSHPRRWPAPQPMHWVNIRSTSRGGAPTRSGLAIAPEPLGTVPAQAPVWRASPPALHSTARSPHPALTQPKPLPSLQIGKQYVDVCLY